MAESNQEQLNKMLMEASAGGHLGGVNTLLDQGADPNAASDGYTALMFASAGGHLDIVRALFNAGADPNAADHTIGTPLMFASQAGYLDVVRELLGRGADRNTAKTERPEPPRCSYAHPNHGHLAVVKELLDRGADPNTARARTIDVTALMYMRPQTAIWRWCGSCSAGAPTRTRRGRTTEPPRSSWRQDAVI
jgi:ankyrin repeat protein